jgi:hypothetical protein
MEAGGVPSTTPPWPDRITHRRSRPSRTRSPSHWTGYRRFFLPHLDLRLRNEIHDHRLSFQRSDDLAQLLPDLLGIPLGNGRSGRAPASTSILTTSTERTAKTARERSRPPHSEQTEDRSDAFTNRTPYARYSPRLRYERSHRRAITLSLRVLSLTASSAWESPPRNLFRARISYRVKESSSTNGPATGRRTWHRSTHLDQRPSER